MSPSRRARPSTGFIGVCLTYVALLAFLGWGLSRPLLDRVWEIGHRLRTGQLQRLSRSDHELLEKALARHPALGAALLGGRDVGVVSEEREGWIATPVATIIRTARARHDLAIEVETPRDLLPLRILVRGPGWQREARAGHPGRIRLPLPPAGPRAELVELEVRGRQPLVADPSMIGLRVEFGPAEGAP